MNESKKVEAMMSMLGAAAFVSMCVSLSIAVGLSLGAHWGWVTFAAMSFLVFVLSYLAARNARKEADDAE